MYICNRREYNSEQNLFNNYTKIMKQLLVLLMLFFTLSVSAQDVIIKKDGSTVVCRVVEVTKSEIVYKRWTDLNGSNFVMERSAASSINYQDGKKIILSEADNLFNPNNQNDGAHQFNDNALLKMDYAAQHPNMKKKAKALKITGIATGLIGVAIGVPLIVKGASSDKGSSHDFWTYGGIGVGFCVAGGLSYYLCNAKANRYLRESSQLYSTNIIKSEFKLNNGCSIIPSIDLIRDQALNQQTLGIGVNYNF